MKIKIDASALKEFYDAIDWYDLQSDGLGKKYKDTVKEQIRLIKRNPQWFPIEIENIYKAYIPKFPYKILYTINEEKEIVIIWAFAHLHRKPWYWKSRVDDKKNGDKNE